MYLVINKWVTAVKVSNFSGHYLRNRWTLDIGILGYIGIVQHKEHSPEVLSIPPGTSCIYWITSNGTGTWNFTLMFGCVLHFTVSFYNIIPFSWMLILQISWYFCSWGIVPQVWKSTRKATNCVSTSTDVLLPAPFLQAHQLLQL